MSSVRVLETPDIHLFFIRSEMIWQEKLLVISDVAHFDHVFFTKNFYNHMAMNDGRSRRGFKWFWGDPLVHILWSFGWWVKMGCYNTWQQICIVLHKYDIKKLFFMSKQAYGTVPKSVLCAYNMFLTDMYCTILYCNISQFSIFQIYGLVYSKTNIFYHSQQSLQYWKHRSK